MSEKMHKRARDDAYVWAKNVKLWDQARKLFPLWRRALSHILRFVKRDLLNDIAWVYRRAIKRYAHEAYARRPGTVAYREMESYARARRKMFSKPKYGHS